MLPSSMPRSNTCLFWPRSLRDGPGYGDGGTGTAVALDDLKGDLVSHTIRVPGWRASLYFGHFF